MAIVHPDRQDEKGFQQSANHSVTDNPPNTGSVRVRQSFESRTASLEGAARTAATAERERSQCRATESTFNARKAEREFVEGARWIPPRHKRPWKNTKWEFQSREVPPLRITQEIRRESCVCEMCGAQFVPKRSDAKTCGSACRQRAYRIRNAPRDGSPVSVVTA
jgi:hypothetical protein